MRSVLFIIRHLKFPKKVKNKTICQTTYIKCCTILSMDTNIFIRGHLISKCRFSVLKLTQKPTNLFLRISVLTQVRNPQIFIGFFGRFEDSKMPLTWVRTEILRNKFVGFWVDFKTLKLHFEIK